jgi:hypothetical protein
LKQSDGEDLHTWSSHTESCVKADLQWAKQKGSLISTVVSVGTEVWLKYDARKGVSCHLCDTKVKDVAVLTFDNSAGEYGASSMCEHCITKLATKFRGIAREKLTMPEEGASQA